MAGTTIALPHRKWAHEPLFDMSKGKVKAHCRCGVQSERTLDSLEEAVAWHEAHVGLKKIQALKDKFDSRR